MMNAYKKFLFDLNGFIVLRQVLTRDEVAAMNSAIDHYISDFQPRQSAGLRNASGSSMAAEGI